MGQPRGERQALLHPQDVRDNPLEARQQVHGRLQRRLGLVRFRENSSGG